MEAPWQLRGQARTRYWIPDGFPEDWRIPREFRYLVIDEFIQDVLTLAVSGWPKIDHDGRLEFPEPTTGVKLRVGSYPALADTAAGAPRRGCRSVPAAATAPRGRLRRGGGPSAR